MKYRYAVDKCIPHTVYRGVEKDDGTVVDCRSWYCDVEEFLPDDDAWGWLTGLEEDSRVGISKEKAMEYIQAKRDAIKALQK